jgi:hypothetical protein
MASVSFVSVGTMALWVNLPFVATSLAFYGAGSLGCMFYRRRLSLLQKR